MAVTTDYRPWRPHTAYNNNNKFQHVGKVYKVLEDYVSGSQFNANDSRIQLVPAECKVIASIDIVNGRLIITYEDGTTHDAGAAGGDANLPITERLIVNESGVLEAPAHEVNLAAFHPKLYVNGIYYAPDTVAGDAAQYTVSAEGFVWKAEADFELNSTFLVIAEYVAV